MPYYTWLRPYKSDSRRTLQTKRRAARKILELRQRFNEHVAEQSTVDGAEVPDESAKVIRIATWNIREFDSSSYGWRSREAKAYLAEVLSFFDLIALQEIRRDLDALEDVRSLLGPNWDFIATDVTDGSAGNKERMAFLFNKNKCWFRGVAGELTLPRGQKITDPFGERFRVVEGATLRLPNGKKIKCPKDLRFDTLSSGETKLEEDVEIPLPEGTQLVLPEGSSVRFAKNARVPKTDDDRVAIEQTSNPTLPSAAEIVLPPNSIQGGSQQFARTPFVVSFQAGWLKINLATVHIYYGSGSTGIQRRTEEIRAVTELLADRAKSDSDSDADAYFIALGDFNIVGRDHQTMEALVTNDFVVPEALQSVPGSNVRQDKFYDQIALWAGRSSRRKSYTDLRPYRAGVFDFFDVVYRLDEEDVYRPFMRKPDSDDFYSSYSKWRTYQMSDHLPMWVELHVDFTEDYLGEVQKMLDDRLDED